MYAKRPKNAYMFFMAEKRADYAEDGMSVGDVARQLGEAWRALSAKKREPYEKMASEDKKRFEEELEQGLSPKPRATKAAKKKKDKDAPKRAKSAYTLFVKSE